MEATRLFDQFRHEWMQFDHIPHEAKWHPDHKICGLAKLTILLNRNPLVMLPGYDRIMLNDVKDIPCITTTDVVFLLRCGINLDHETCRLFMVS